MRPVQRRDGTLMSRPEDRTKPQQATLKARVTYRKELRELSQQLISKKHSKSGAYSVSKMMRGTRVKKNFRTHSFVALTTSTSRTGAAEKAASTQKPGLGTVT